MSTVRAAQRQGRGIRSSANSTKDHDKSTQYLNACQCIVTNGTNVVDKAVNAAYLTIGG